MLRVFLLLALLLLALVVSERRVLEGFNSDKLLFHPAVEPHLERRGIKRNDRGMYFQRGSKRVSFNDVGDLNSKKTSLLARSKSGTNEYLASQGFPVPRLVIWDRSKSHVRNLEEVERRLDYPVVVKPDVGSHGRDVVVGVSNATSLVNAVVKLNASDKVIIEEQLEGEEYRINVTGGKVVAISLRKPPVVVGNGTSTLESLIAERNEEASVTGETKARKKGVTVDYDFLRRHAKVLQSVPGEGEVVVISPVSNYSNGGTFEPIPVRMMHRVNRQMLEDVSATTGGVNLGIDFMVSNDISVPYSNANSAGIIEINTNPGVTGTLGCREEAEKRNMIDAVIDNLFGRS